MWLPSGLFDGSQFTLGAGRGDMRVDGLDTLDLGSPSNE